MAYELRRLQELARHRFILSMAIVYAVLPALAVPGPAVMPDAAPEQEFLGRLSMVHDYAELMDRASRLAAAKDQEPGSEDRVIRLIDRTDILSREPDTTDGGTVRGPAATEPTAGPEADHAASRMVALYGTLEPKHSAELLSRFDPAFTAELLSRMDVRAAAEVFAELPPDMANLVALSLGHSGSPSTIPAGEGQ
jgi:hypothetical protein